MHITCHVKKIIHVSSPEWLDGLHGEDILLASCYTEALRLADENNMRTIAFPLIAGGSNGFPCKTALSIARETLQNFIYAQYDLDVLLVMYDNSGDDFDEKSGCDYSSDNEEVWLDNKNIVNDKNGNAINKSSDFSFDDKLDKSFSETLTEFLLKKNVKNVDCYKRANLDRKLFSKIINGSIPKKRTIFALCIALKLSLAEAETLLNSAGYTFSHSFQTDLIVEYFIVNKKYNIYELNGILRKNNLPMLGSI